MSIPIHLGRSRTALFITLTLLAISASSSVAVAELATGDVAVIAYRSDDPDALAFVTLASIPSGTEIRFTDSGWISGSGFRDTEGGIMYTAPSTLPAGTVVTGSNPFNSGDWSINNTGVGSNGLMLSTSGDQILAFQGDAATPTFIYALTYDSTGWSNATSSNTTALPPGVYDGTSAVSLGSPERDNGYYAGPTTGTAGELLESISDPANWVCSDSTQTWPSWSFTVGGGGTPVVINVATDDSNYDAGDPGVVTVTLDNAPGTGTPATISLSSGAFDSSPVDVVISNPDTSGWVSVTMANTGTWTVSATAVSGCTGDIDSDSFTVAAGPVPPVAYAGLDRTIYLTDGSIVTETLTGASASDDNGLTGLSYEWTPASGAGIVTWTDRTGLVSDPNDPSNATITFDTLGIYTLTLEVTDPDYQADTDDVVIYVVEAPTSDYDPPSDYYDPARPGGVWLTGESLKSALRSIISSGQITRSYDTARQSLPFYDEDPEDPEHIILVYTGASVTGTWDGGTTWNREHLWPQSLYDYDSSITGDVFNLRGCNPSVNSSRGNSPYGVGSGYWDPDHGASDRGECARAMFYMATRYSQLSLVYGTPDVLEMGDLGELLYWHYEDPVTDAERLRNHLIYDWNDNPSYYQANRNPFVDHPELVWSIWGTGDSDAQLYVGSAPAGDGSSSASIDFGTRIVGATQPTPVGVVLHKLGSAPTTYAIVTSTPASCTPTGQRQAFATGVQSVTLSVGVTSTTQAGSQFGTVIIDNTELTSAATGEGSSDADDTITVSALVVDHAEASFSEVADQDELTLDFGTLTPDSGTYELNFSVYNLEAASGYTAGLDLDAIVPSGDTTVIGTDLATFADLPAGSQHEFAVTCDTSAGTGSKAAVFALSVSDADLPGASTGTSLTLTVTVEIAESLCRGDANCDGQVNFDDIDYFVAALIAESNWNALFSGSPPCSYFSNDCDDNGIVNFDDVDPFVAALTSGVCIE